MKAVSASRREQVRAMLADLKMPGALEAVDSVLSDADGGGVTTAEAIERLLGAQITLRNNRRLQAAMRSSRLPVVKTLDEFLERCDELGEGAVVNPAAVLRRRDGETDREMGLSDTGRSQQDDVLLALDEAELVEILDLFTLDGRLEREVGSPSRRYVGPTARRSQSPLASRRR